MDIDEADEQSRRINEALRAGPLSKELDRRAAAEGRTEFTTEEVLAELDRLEADEPEHLTLADGTVLRDQTARQLGLVSD